MIIDADSHYLDPDVFKYVNQENKHKIPRFVFDHENRLIKVEFDKDPNFLSCNTLPPWSDNEYAGISNLDSRIEDFKRLSIDFQILNPQELALRFSYLVEKNLATNMAQSYNRRLLEICSEYPNKFAGPGLLALQDIDWSLNEIDWCKKVGINSVIIDNCWPDISDGKAYPLMFTPRFEEICSACQKNNMLLSIHGAHHKLPPKRSIPQFKAYDSQSISPGFARTSLVGLIISNILDKYPDLKVLLNEGGMNYPLRMYELLKRNEPNRDIDRYFQNNFHFTIETEQTDKLLSVIKKIGADKFLFATDYPHNDDGGANKFNDYEDFKNLSISENDFNLIGFKNAINLFQLDKEKINQ